MQTIDGRTVLTHPIERPGWSVQDGYLGDDVAVFVEVNAEALRVAISAYRISTGEALDTSKTRRDVLGPETDLAGTRLVYAQGVPQEGMCLHVLDLIDGTDGQVVCDKPSVQLGDLAFTGGHLSYTRLTHSTTPQRCKSVAVVEIATVAGRHNRAAETAAQDSSPCGNWSAVPLATASLVWDNADPQVGLSTASLFAYSDGETVPLGSGYTDSARSCGGWAFWLRVGPNQFSEIVGWTPGLSEPVEIRPSEDDVEWTTPYCADDRWLTTRADDIGGRDEHLALWRLDTEGLPTDAAD